jgi:hypothetical protein
MLKPVKPSSRLVPVRSHYRLYVNIIIVLFNICEVMVIDIVLLPPQVSIASHQIKRIGHNLIHPGLIGIAAMRAIVHDIEADACKNKTEQYTKQKRNPPGRIQQQQQINSNC